MQLHIDISITPFKFGTYKEKPKTRFLGRAVVTRKAAGTLHTVVGATAQSVFQRLTTEIEREFLT